MAVRVDGELEVLRRAVVRFGLARERAKGLQLAVREHGGARTLVTLQVDSLYSAGRGRRLEHELLLCDRSREHAERLLVEHVSIGRDLAADDDLAETPCRLDDDPADVLRGGIGGEDHAGLS